MNWLDEISEKMDPELSPFAHEKLREVDVRKLIEALRLAIFSLEELNEQSIAHSDNSLSSKWIETITAKALTQIAELGAKE